MTAEKQNSSLLRRKPLMAAEAAYSGEDRRKAQRPRTLKKGRIVYNNGFSTMDCLVRNLTEFGAKLALDQPQGLPETFELIVDDAPAKACTVRWRKLKELGVQFT